MNLHRAAAYCAAGFLAASMLSHTVALRFALLFTAAGMLVVVAVRERASVRWIPPLWSVYAVWALWALLSVAWSPEPDRALKEFRHEILYTALTYCVCFAAAQAPGALHALLRIGSLGAVIACGLSLYAYTTDWEHYQQGWHGGSGNHSSLLLTLMPCALMTLWYGAHNRWNRVRLWVTGSFVALLLAAAYSTQNRTVWLGFGAELLMMMGLLYATRPASGDPSRPRAKWGAVLLAFAVVAGAVVATAIVHRERTADRSALALERDPRLVLWADVVKRIEERPWTGYGFGRGVLRASLREETGDGMLWHAHNIFLDVAVQLGIPGLLLFLLLLSVTFREAWRLCRNCDELQVACGLALAAVIVGMLARNMTDVLWIRQNSLVYWGVAGTLLGLAAKRRERTLR